MANELPHEELSRDVFLFQHLVAMFQTLALQQMGKLTNPLSGEVERDLHQARITIDMLDMISLKTAGNLSEPERRLLDGVLMELRMNFVDESSKPGEEPGDGEEPAEEASGDGDAAAGGDLADSGNDNETGDET